MNTEIEYAIDDLITHHTRWMLAASHRTASEEAAFHASRRKLVELIEANSAVILPVRDVMTDRLNRELKGMTQ